MKNFDKPDIDIKMLKEFDDWCRWGIKNYKNFPVGRTDKLSRNIIAQFIQYKLGVSYEDALHSEYQGSIFPSWGDAIRKWWINK